MLQALFALALAVAFMPAFVKKIASGNIHRENIAIASQMAAAFDASRAFVYEKFDDFPDGITTLAAADFVQTLEPYGLPLGFAPMIPPNNPIPLRISKKGRAIFVVLSASGEKFGEMRRAEILARLGFWGAVLDDDGIVRGATGGWEEADIPNEMALDPHDIMVRVPEDEEFSELVARNAKNPAKNIFHSDLNMDGNNVSGIGSLSAIGGKIKNIGAGEFALSGTETDRKNKNDIGIVRAGKVWFSAADGNPLTITRSDLKTGQFSVSSIANYGDMPSLTAGTLTIRDFNMTAGRTGFAGPNTWNIKTSAYFTNITLSVEKLSIASFLDTSRGQDVFLNADNPDQLEYTAGSGVRANEMKADSIVLRDQISSDLLAGGTGAALIEIRPAGTSILPDILISGINNDNIKIPAAAADNSGNTESCKNIIIALGGKYNSASAAQNVICQFVMYNRIEHRIEIKKCLLNGGPKCF